MNKKTEYETPEYYVELEEPEMEVKEEMGVAETPENKMKEDEDKTAMEQNPGYPYPGVAKTDNKKKKLVPVYPRRDYPAPVLSEILTKIFKTLESLDKRMESIEKKKGTMESNEMETPETKVEEPKKVPEENKDTEEVKPEEKVVEKVEEKTEEKEVEAEVPDRKVKDEKFGSNIGFAERLCIAREGGLI